MEMYFEPMVSTSFPLPSSPHWVPRTASTLDMLMVSHPEKIWGYKDGGFKQTPFSCPLSISRIWFWYRKYGNRTIIWSVWCRTSKPILITITANSLRLQTSILNRSHSTLTTSIKIVATMLIPDVQDMGHRKVTLSQISHFTQKGFLNSV